ncbi:MAG: phosphoglucosamine mutase [Ruminiclostridium sp.]|nr:phosphoglucosamine mutase [Ruminiclostridium sp.]
MGRLFGTDGARGVAITELTCELAMNIGRAAALVLTKSKPAGEKAKILIGKDTRVSSDILEAALTAGIMSVGADAVKLGVVPTPAVAYLVKHEKADAGVMISASHNSVEYNGIKLFAGTGFKLPDEVENEIEALILDTPEQILLKNGTEVGRVTELDDAAEMYVDHLVSCAGIKNKGLRIIADCANGSASATALSLFGKLGVRCDIINANPDGCNINENCGSTHIERLQEKMKSGKYDVGVAFDGDADRCLAVDETGALVDGDRLIAMISGKMKAEGKLKRDTAVVTVMSNLGFHTYMTEHGINTVCTKVGDRYVLEEMLKSGYNIGGEQSGHIIFLDHATTGDGQLTAVKLISMLSQTDRKLSEYNSEFMEYPQLLMNVKITEDKKGLWDKNEAILAAIGEAENELGSSGRVLVRESGTEPLVRVMIEGKDAALVEKHTNRIADAVRTELCG